MESITHPVWPQFDGLANSSLLCQRARAHQHSPANHNFPGIIKGEQKGICCQCAEVLQLTCTSAGLRAGLVQADYSPDCVTQLANQQQRRVKDWRLDYELRQACKADVVTVRPASGFEGRTTCLPGQ